MSNAWVSTPDAELLAAAEEYEEKGPSLEPFLLNVARDIRAELRRRRRGRASRAVGDWRRLRRREPTIDYSQMDGFERVLFLSLLDADLDYADRGWVFPPDIGPPALFETLRRYWREGAMPWQIGLGRG